MRISTNLLGVLTGVAIVFTGSLIAYLFQSKLFRKYEQKASNAAQRKTR